MIDFRYHLVSIVAVFLALSIGIVLGATTFREPMLETLTSRTEDLAQDNQNLQANLRELQEEAKGSDEFVTRITPQLVSERLAGERVVFVEAPGVDDSLRDEVIRVVEESDATVTGRLTIQNKYLADSETNVIDELATRLKPSQLSLSGDTAYERGAEVLAAAVVTDETSAAGREDAAGNAVLSGFETAEYISRSGNPAARATLAVVIAPSTPLTGRGAAQDNAALVALAAALDEYGRGAVLVGPYSSGGRDGLVKALRDSDATERVSTVDAADTAPGRVVSVLALEQELAGRTGRYGTAPGARDFLPTPYPTPSGSPQ